jgi:hypothetical protein
MSRNMYMWNIFFNNCLIESCVWKYIYIYIIVHWTPRWCLNSKCTLDVAILTSVEIQKLFSRIYRYCAPDYCNWWSLICARKDVRLLGVTCDLIFSRAITLAVGPASWSSSQSFWLLIMRSRIRFAVLPWVFLLEEEDSHGDHGLGSLV